MRSTHGLPYFGICFGNQLFGRALGFGTFKLKYGHRGINQPVMDRTTGKVEVTAHNHGFAVDAPLEGATETPYGEATVSHVCLNDDVVEGLELRDEDGRLKSFSVQYHPEAAAGPHDAAYLFDRFVDLMQGDAAAVGRGACAAAPPELSGVATPLRSFLAPRASPIHAHPEGPGGASGSGGDADGGDSAPGPLHTEGDA